MTLLEIHQQHLERQRHAMNLVGPGEISFHYQDCEAALRWLSPEGTWADLGTGAGFPGIVLAALFPQLEVHLIESRRKRCVFLEQVLLTAQIPPEQVRVRCERVEQVPDQSFDGVVARAFAPPGEVLRVAARLLRPGGTVVLFLQEDGPIPQDATFAQIHTEHYQLGTHRRKAVGLRRLDD